MFGHSDEAPKRPVLRWHGGKWKLAPWIVGHFPPHRIYTDTYGGGGSVLIYKKPVYCEVYNDLDDDVVNLFEVMRNPGRADELLKALTLTPFSRTEFERSYEEAEDLIERARRLVIRSYMGFGTDGPNREVRTGFRSNSHRSGTTPAMDWRNYPDCLRDTLDRFRGLVIENRDAKDVMAAHDSPETLHYVDPPYLPETRSNKSRKRGGQYHAYRFELTVDDHRELLGFLKTLTGMVVLSGYPSELYDETLLGDGWKRCERTARADGARIRTECLWLSPNVEVPAPMLFESSEL